MMYSLLDYVKKSPVSHLLMSITFVLSGIIINFVQCILFYCLRPFSKFYFRKINYYLAYSLHAELVFMAEWWSKSDVYIYIDKDDFKKYYGKEHAYLVMNHRYDIDWLMGWVFCERLGVLGNCKAYAKKSIQYVPTMGWGWKFSESVFLERSFDKDKEAIARQIKELGDYPDPIWLLIFAEGTRYTEEKYEASLTFAKDKGLPLLKHHLTPRTKGFTISITNMRGKFNAVYNVQLAFKEDAKVKPTMMNLLFGKPIEAHLLIERIPLEEVPEKEEEAAKWLHDLYVKKRQNDG
uniref:Phospholipid/glycerol acyltransferase domain-containing protein n=1 Tax=Clastoptera arizonana TaxID=38151 RepID=A0A1B6DHQ2_9HEMI